MAAKEGIIIRVKQAKEESTGIVDYGFSICAILVSTLGCLICLGVITLFPLLMIIIGSIYVHDCPIQKNIPIFLIVGGVAGIVKSIIVGYLRSKSEKNETISNLWKTASGLYQLFLFIWFILGCVWIYGSYKPNYENLASPDYCNKTLYLFAFWSMTIGLILAGVGLVFLVCCCICGCFAMAGDTSDASPPPPQVQAEV